MRMACWKPLLLLAIAAFDLHEVAATILRPGTTRGFGMQAITMPEWREVSPKGSSVELNTVLVIWNQQKAHDLADIEAQYRQLRASEAWIAAAKAKIEAYYDQAIVCLRRNDMKAKFGLGKYANVLARGDTCLRELAIPTFDPPPTEAPTPAPTPVVMPATMAPLRPGDPVILQLMNEKPTNMPSGVPEAAQMVISKPVTAVDVLKVMVSNEPMVVPAPMPTEAPTPAPVLVMPAAPVVEMPLSVMETPVAAPVVETPAPVVETIAAVTTSPPVVETPAPAVETAAPIVASQAPVVMPDTAAPPMEKLAPVVVETSMPVTEAPTVVPDIMLTPYTTAAAVMTEPEPVNAATEPPTAIPVTAGPTGMPMEPVVSVATDAPTVAPEATVTPFTTGAPETIAPFEAPAPATTSPVYETPATEAPQDPYTTSAPEPLAPVVIETPYTTGAPETIVPEPVVVYETTAPVYDTPIAISEVVVATEAPASFAPLEETTSALDEPWTTSAPAIGNVPAPVFTYETMAPFVEDVSSPVSAEPTLPPPALLLSVASPVLPPFVVLDLDQSESISRDEWQSFTLNLKRLALDAIQNLNIKSQELATHQIEFHYANLHECIARKLDHDQLVSVPIAAFESIADWIDAQCPIALAYSMLAGPPPFEYIANELHDVELTNARVQGWLIRQAGQLMQSIENGQVFVHQPASLSGVAVCVPQCIPSNDKVVTDAIYKLYVDCMSQCIHPPIESEPTTTVPETPSPVEWPEAPVLTIAPDNTPGAAPIAIETMSPSVEVPTLSTTFPLRVTSTQLPPFKVLDHDHSGSISSTELQLFVNTMQKMAADRVMTLRDEMAKSLLLSQVQFHYSSLKQCMIQRLINSGAPILPDPSSFQSYARWIQAHCAIKLRFSLLAGPPPFELLVRDQESIAQSFLTQWFTTQLNRAMDFATSPNGPSTMTKQLTALHYCINESAPTLPETITRSVFYDFVDQVGDCTNALTEPWKQWILDLFDN